MRYDFQYFWAVKVFATLCLVWGLFFWKKKFHKMISLRRSQGKLTLDQTSLEVFEKIFSLVVLFVSALSILNIVGVNIVPLLTLSGIGAAALGFASRDVIANFFSGMMIYLTRPFSVGDFIEMPEKKIMGNIEEIGWYFASIRDLHKRPLYIPNSIFSTGLLMNHSRITHRRIEEKIRIRQVDVERARRIIQEIRELFGRYLEIDREYPPEIFLRSLSPFSLEIDIKAYTSIIDFLKFMEFRQMVLFEVYTIAYQTSEPVVKPPAPAKPSF